MQKLCGLKGHICLSEQRLGLHQLLNYNSKTEKKSLLLLPSEILRIAMFCFPFSHLIQSLFPEHPYAWDVRVGRGLRTHCLHHQLVDMGHLRLREGKRLGQASQ